VRKHLTMKTPKSTEGWTWKEILEDSKEGDPTDFGPSYLSMLEAAYREGYGDGYHNGGDTCESYRRNDVTMREETKSWQDSETLKDNQ